jgi:hypothetical protein
MKTSWNEIRQIELYLSGSMKPEDKLVFEARILSNPVLNMSVRIQRKLHVLLRLYHRAKIKKELDGAHKKFFGDPSKEYLTSEILRQFKL